MCSIPLPLYLCPHNLAQLMSPGPQVNRAPAGTARNRLCKVRTEIDPQQHIAVPREQMALHDGIEGRHPVEEALGARSLLEKLVG